MRLAPESDEYSHPITTCGMPNRIAKERWAPPCEDTTNTLCSTDLAPSLKIALVHLRIYLTTAFDQVQRRHSRMGQTLPYS